jgi:hypothetical protein
MSVYLVANIPPAVIDDCRPSWIWRTPLPRATRGDIEGFIKFLDESAVLHLFGLRQVEARLIESPKQ